MKCAERVDHQLWQSGECHRLFPTYPRTGFASAIGADADAVVCPLPLRPKSVFPQHLGRCTTLRLARLGAEPRRVLFDKARAVAADEFVPLDGRRHAPGRRRVLNSMARKPLLAGGKDFPDKPLRAPLLERPRQLGHLTRDDRQDIGLQVAALVEEGKDRRDVGASSICH
jgi:hypothetical protein